MHIAYADYDILGYVFIIICRHNTEAALHVTVERVRRKFETFLIRLPVFI